MKQSTAFLPPGDICIGVVRDGKLNIGGGFEYEAPLKDGKYIITPFVNGSLLFVRSGGESAQLLSEVSRGICLSGGPFHIRGYIVLSIRKLKL